MTIALFSTHWLPAFAWAGLIFFLSSIPSLNSGLGMWDTVLRKIAHVVEYAIFAALFFRAFRKTWEQMPLKKILFFTGFISVAYAASDEFHQAFVPGRGPSVQDVLIDSVGVGLALAWKFKYSSSI